LFFSQVEFCENLIFRRRAALDQLGERLLDANRNLGRPDKLTVIFGLQFALVLLGDAAKITVSCPVGRGLRLASRSRSPS